MEEKLKQLEEVLCYWKDHISLQDVLSNELSYSLIYNNIHPDKIDQAMATVGLTRLPTHIFLIQVDDYQNYANRLRVTQEFFQKTRLVNLLREEMAQLALQGFAANLVGKEQIICFLYCQDQDGPELEQHLLDVAEQFKKTVRKHSPYTISVCVSRRCINLSQFPLQYPQMESALGRSYLSGKEFTILMDRAGQNSAEATATDLDHCYPELLAAVARRDPDRLERALQHIFQLMLSAQMGRQKVRTELWRLMQQLEEYCLQCGIPEGWLRSQNEFTTTQLLACSFLADTRVCFRHYCEQLSQALEESGTDEDSSFKVPVEEYVAAHYGESLRLSDVADVLGFSEGHFARTFRKKFGCSFVEYLTQYRISESKRLLADTKVPIEQIAYRVGLSSHNYFCTCFKRSCGMTPGAYRSQVLAQNIRKMKVDVRKTHTAHPSNALK